MATVTMSINPKILIYEGNENNTFTVTINIKNATADDGILGLSIQIDGLLERGKKYITYNNYKTGSFTQTFTINYNELNWEGSSLGGDIFATVYHTSNIPPGSTGDPITWVYLSQDTLENSYYIYSSDPLKNIRFYNESLEKNSEINEENRNYYIFEQLYSNIPYKLSYINNFDKENISFYSPLITSSLQYFTEENGILELKGTFLLDEYDYSFQNIMFSNNEIKNYTLKLKLKFLNILNFEDKEYFFNITVYPYQKNEIILTYDRQTKNKDTKNEDTWFSLPFGETILYKLSFKDSNSNIPFYFNNLSIELIPYDFQNRYPVTLLSYEKENKEELSNFNFNLKVRDELNEFSPYSFHNFYLYVRDGISEYMTTYKIFPYFNQELTLEKGAILLGTGMAEEGLNYITTSYSSEKNNFLTQPFCFVNNAHISDFKKFVSFNRTNYFSKWNLISLYNKVEEICGEMKCRVSMDGTVHLKGFLDIAGDISSCTLASLLPFLILPEEDKDFYTPTCDSSSLFAHFRLTLNGDFILKRIRNGASNNTSSTVLHINFDFTYNVPYIWKKAIDEDTFNSENINFYQNLGFFPESQHVSSYSYETQRFFPSSEQSSYPFRNTFSFKRWRTSTSDLNPYLIFCPQGKIEHEKFNNFFSISEIELRFYHSKNPLNLIKRISLIDGEWSFEDTNIFEENGIIQSFSLSEDLGDFSTGLIPEGETEENIDYDYVITLPCKNNFYNLKIAFELQDNATNLDLRRIELKGIQKIYHPGKNYSAPSSYNYFGLSSIEETINNYDISSNWEIK